ncbi:MAG: peptidase M23 [Rhodobacterales bacterium]|nr:MAG: peptidase M23 [Rhodobacterales bacterium]
MKGWRSISVILALLAMPAAAETDSAHLAKRAAAQLNAASLSLQRADQASDRVAALTETVQAYEQGLVAMRQGMRQAAIREQSLRLEFEAKSEDLSQLLGVLQSMQATSSPLLLLHPSGPVGTARSGMILSEVTPALQARADHLRTQLEEVALLRSLQQNSADVLRNGLSGVQKARTELSLAISERTKLPMRFTEDPVKTAILLDSSETLQGFADGLSQISEDTPQPIDMPDFDTAKGALALPVNGTVLRGYNQADAADVRRPGLLIATRPRAIVTTPWPATIRYRGPLLDYGNVIILEPSEGYLLVLAGLNHVYGEIGEILSKGAPVGLMGGNAPQGQELLLENNAGVANSQTLYIELRKGKTPVNPENWFALQSN